MLNVFFFENRLVYDIIWKNIVGPNRPQMTIERMRIACWIIKATSKHSGYLIINAFSRQRWLRQRTSVLRDKSNILPVIFQSL